MEYEPSDWEDDAYENGHHSHEAYSRYSIQDLTGEHRDIFYEFDPGTIQVYQPARVILERAGQTWEDVIVRHVQRDYGDQTMFQVVLNEQAFEKREGQILSKYFFGNEGVEVKTDLDAGVTAVKDLPVVSLQDSHNHLSPRYT